MTNGDGLIYTGIWGMLGGTTQVRPESGSSPSRLREERTHAESGWGGGRCEALDTPALFQVRPLCFEPKVQEEGGREESSKQLGLRLPGQPPVILLIVRY